MKVQEKLSFNYHETFHSTRIINHYFQNLLFILIFHYPDYLRLNIFSHVFARTPQILHSE